MDVKQIERLEAWLRIAPDMGGCFELPEDCRDDIDALLQLARAVNEAPRGVLSRADVGAWNLPETFAGQTVALVPVPVKEGKDA